MFAVPFLFTILFHNDMFIEFVELGIVVFHIRAVQR